jgi:hypothetical protein
MGGCKKEEMITKDREEREKENWEGRFGRGCFRNGSCDPFERVSALAEVDWCVT